MPQSFKKSSKDIFKDELAKFAQIFPQFIKDDKIDFKSFKQFLKKKNLKDNKNNGFGFRFAGKSRSFNHIKKQNTDTLNPQKENSVNFDKSENLFIEGDNLDVLKLLQKYYHNKIKMIYIDPPYNTGKDFIYKDNYTDNKSDYLEKIGASKDGIKLETNANSNGRYHSDWLSMIYPRLFLARQLLKDDGVIFISIDDNEQHHLRMLMNEVFGEVNFVANVVWKRKRGRDNSARWFSKSHEYLITFAKNKDLFEVNYLELDETTKKAYKNPDKDKRGNYRMLATWARGTQGGVKYDFTDKNNQYFKTRLWLMSKKNLTKLDNEDKLIIRGDNIYRKLFLTENKGKIPETIWQDVSNAANASDEIKSIFSNIIFDTAKPIPYIQEAIKVATNKNDIILDFFAGSATTGQAVMDLNQSDDGTRKFILVQIPETTDEKSVAYQAGYKNIAQIGIDRLKKAIKKHDYKDGFKVFAQADTNFNLPPNTNKTPQKILNYNTLKTNIKIENLLYEIILKQGLSLHSTIVKNSLLQQSSNKEVLTRGHAPLLENDIWQITDKQAERTIYFTLSDKLDNATIKNLKVQNGDTLICRDQALNDTQKTNLTKNIKLLTF
ncbi:MAG: site-specific DNA-methyltransferase [Gammaproteobacteria bacterium]|nr:MAG: site-specific DNA-methyltransferase [Gammaproteobacteria bacterium]